MILCIISLITTVSRKNLLSDINSFNQKLFKKNAGIQAKAWQETGSEISNQILQPSSGILAEKGDPESRMAIY